MRAEATAANVPSSTDVRNNATAPARGSDASFADLLTGRPGGEGTSAPTTCAAGAASGSAVPSKRGATAATPAAAATPASSEDAVTPRSSAVDTADSASTAAAVAQAVASDAAPIAANSPLTSEATPTNSSEDDGSSHDTHGTGRHEPASADADADADAATAAAASQLAAQAAWLLTAMTLAPNAGAGSEPGAPTAASATAIAGVATQQTSASLVAANTLAARAASAASAASAKALLTNAPTASTLASTDFTSEFVVTGSSIPAPKTGAASARVVAAASTLEAVGPAIAPATLATDSSDSSGQNDQAGATNTGSGPDLAALASLLRNPTAGPVSVDSPDRHITLPVFDSAWPHAVAAQLQLMASANVQNATLRLSPEHLGPVEVHIDLEASQINVNFVAAHPDTRSALEQSVPTLRAMLAQGGLTLGQTQVQSETRSGSQFAPQRTRGGPAVTVEAPVSVRTQSIGLVDEYA